MLTIESLQEFGANTEEGLGRCFGNEDFYLKLVRSVPEEQTFDRLAEAIAANDLDAAFDAAHALKGVLGNLSLTALYEPICEITELLRPRTQMDYSEKLSDILNKREELSKICESE